MRKEILVAIIAGSILGLIIAFGIWRANVFFKDNQNLPPEETVESSPSALPTSFFGITLAKPSNEDVVTKIPSSFSGITQPVSWVVISGEDEDYIVQTDQKGEFNQDVDLIPGVNQVLISSFALPENSASTKLTLVYSTELSASIPSATTEPLGTSGGDIREKVLKKVEEVLSNPKAILGTVTDISESALQIKTASGEIRQAAPNKDVTVIKTTKTSTGSTKIQEVKLADVAIGDFIVAMGFKNGSGVLDARRILVIPALEEPMRKIVTGKITAISKKDITIQPLAGGDEIVLIPSKNSSIKISELSIDYMVIVVTLPGQTGTEVRTLQVVETQTPEPSPTP